MLTARACLRAYGVSRQVDRWSRDGVGDCPPAGRGSLPADHGSRLPATGPMPPCPGLMSAGIDPVPADLPSLQACTVSMSTDIDSMSPRRESIFTAID